MGKPRPKGETEFAKVAKDPVPIATSLVTRENVFAPNAMAPVALARLFVPMAISLELNVPKKPVSASDPIEISSVPKAALGLSPSAIAIDGKPTALAPTPNAVCAKADGADAKPMAASRAVTPPDPNEPRPRFLRLIPRKRCAMRNTANRRRRSDPP